MAWTAQSRHFDTRWYRRTSALQVYTIFSFLKLHISSKPHSHSHRTASQNQKYSPSTVKLRTIGSITLFDVCVLATAYLLAQDLILEHHSSTVSQTEMLNYIKKILYFSITGTVAVLLGFLTLLIIANEMVETRIAHEVLIHIRLAYILIVEDEYWRDPFE